MKTGLNKAAVTLRRIRITVFFLFFLFIFRVFFSISARIFITYSIFMLILYILLIFCYVPAQQKHSKFYLSTTKLEWDTGVFFRVSVKTHPRRILYTRLSQTPLQRALHLCTIRLFPIGKPIFLRDFSISDGISIKEGLENSYGP